MVMIVCHLYNRSLFSFLYQKAWVEYFRKTKSKNDGLKLLTAEEFIYPKQTNLKSRKYLEDSTFQHPGNESIPPWEEDKSWEFVTLPSKVNPLLSAKRGCLKLLRRREDGADSAQAC